MPWEFAHSRGTRSDGVWYEASLNYTHEVTPLGGPDWVWVVHFPHPNPRKVWIDPVKRGVEIPVALEAYIDTKWPAPSQVCDG